MSEADELRAEVTNAIHLTEQVQIAALQYQETIHQLQSAIIMLDLGGSNNAFVRSVARMAPLLSRGNLDEDKEMTGQIKTELQTWLPYV